MKAKILNVGKIVIAVCLLISIVFGILSISTINSSTYKYYRSQYLECSSGYAKCISQAASSSNVYIKALYKKMANEYYSLKEKWEDRMEDIEAKATAFGVISGVFFLITLGSAALLVIKARKAKLATPESEYMEIESNIDIPANEENGYDEAEEPIETESTPEE